MKDHYVINEICNIIFLNKKNWKNNKKNKNKDGQEQIITS